jgi:hypothetical protein
MPVDRLRVPMAWRRVPVLVVQLKAQRLSQLVSTLVLTLRVLDVLRWDHRPVELCKALGQSQLVSTLVLQLKVLDVSLLAHQQVYPGKSQLLWP